MAQAETLKKAAINDTAIQKPKLLKRHSLRKAVNGLVQ
jgi:hypothetical protein